MSMEDVVMSIIEFVQQLKHQNCFLGTIVRNITYF